MTGVEAIKALDSDTAILLKDIPIDHIVKGVQVLSRSLYIRYFKGYRIQVHGKKRVRQLIEREILEKENDELAQLLMTLWNRANGPLYHGMYNQVRQINEDVDEIEKIEDESAEKIIDELAEDFDSARIFACVLFNEVKFSKEIIEKKLGKPVPIDPWPPEVVPEESEEGEEGEEEAEAPAQAEEAPVQTEEAPAE